MTTKTKKSKSKSADITEAKEGAFSFTSDAATFNQQLSKVLSVTAFSYASDSEKHHLLMSSKGKVFLVGLSPETFVCVELKVDEKPKATGCFGFDISTLQGLLKRRDAMSFEFANNTLKLRALKGKYSCDLKTVEVPKEYLTRINKTLSQTSKGDKLSSEELDALKDAIAHTSLREVYMDDKDNSLLCYITVSNGRLTVSAMDNFHMAHYEAKIKSKSTFRLAISSSMFALISKFVADSEQAATFGLGAKGLSVSGDDFIVNLPPSQVEDTHFGLVPTFLKNIVKSECDFGLPQTAFDTIDNMKSLARNDEKFQFQLSSKGIVKLTIETDNGTVSDAFKASDAHVKKDQKWNIDPRLFFDLYKKIRTLKCDIPISLHSAARSAESAFFITKLSLSKTSRVTLVGTYE